LFLTGVNVDWRVRVRDSQLAVVAGVLVHRIIVARIQGPLAGDAAVAAALAPFAADAVVSWSGVVF